MEDIKLLINKILAGNTNAFQSFIEQYQRLVSHIVFRMINKEQDREDICQDVFLKVYQNLSSFKFEAKLSTWIAKIAYNTCINYLEKMKVPLFNDISADEFRFLGNNITPDKFTEERDISLRLQIEIDNMPVQFRTILTLFHLDEMSYNEIAEVLQLPEGTVKSYLFRARKQLKERLMSKYKQEELWH